MENDNDFFKDVRTFFSAIGMVAMLVMTIAFLNDMLYRDTEAAYCNCTITGKAQIGDNNIASVDCGDVFRGTVQYLSDLEWQAIDVDGGVTVVQVRTSMVSIVRYKIMLTHLVCESR